jgi:hypothetical protein
LNTKSKNREGNQTKISTTSPWQNTVTQLNITDGKFVKDFGFCPGEIRPSEMALIIAKQASRFTW